jgi:hypothetical protein
MIEKGLVHTVPGAAEISVENHEYTTDRGRLPFDLYRPRGASGAVPATVFVTGYPDPGAAAFFGKPLMEWGSYKGWGRLVAASGIAGITYLNREPTDAAAIVQHVRANAGTLGVDPARIGIWSCSGNVPQALWLLARERLACAALLYGFMLDLDGGTDVAQFAARFGMAVPPVTLDELPRDVPVLVVRAGKDENPGLNTTIDRFVAAAKPRGLAVTVVDHPDGPHAFDIVDDSPRSHEVIDEVLAFLRRSLGS